MRPLAVIGNVNIDLIMGPVAPWPQPGTEVIVDHDDMRVGGSAGNTARAWEALGVDYQIAASVGDDLFGTWLLQAYGRRADAWPVTDRTTISVGVTHPSGERTFFSSKGHVPLLDWRSARAALDGNRLSGGILLVCGAFLTDALTADYGEIFDWADAHGIDVALDTGWPLAGFTPEVRDLTRGWLPRCRHVLFNEIETTALAGIDDPMDAARHLVGLVPENGVIVTKLGPKGASAIMQSGETFRFPAPEVHVVDTIGAGDVFNAGYLLRIAQGDGLASALQTGVVLASNAVATWPRRYDLGETGPVIGKG